MFSGKSNLKSLCDKKFLVSLRFIELFLVKDCYLLFVLTQMRSIH
jgi:hypothetical protein